MSDFHLLEEQLPGLMRYATALTRDADDAEELVADTIREALANQRRCPSNANIRIWLLTILHELRGNPFRQNFTARSPACDPRAPWTLSQLDRALGQLPEEQRAAILLIGLEDTSYAQTAAILGVSVGTIRSRVSRGRDGLRRAMGVAATAPRWAARAA